MAIAKDCALQLYRSLFAKLTADSALLTLLGVTDVDLDPKVYQTFIDFDSNLALKSAQWISFNISNDRTFPVEQIQDIREITLDVHIWVRGPGSDVADAIETRVRELLDDADLSTANLFAWQCYTLGYSKGFDTVTQLWHVISTYHVMAMAQT